MKRVYVYFSLLVLVMTLSSCIKDRFDVDEVGFDYWNPDMAVPLINSKTTLEHISRDMGLDFDIGPDNLFSIVFADTVYSVYASELYDIPDQQAQTTFEVDFPAVVLPPGDSIVVSKNFISTVTTPDNDRVDSMKIRKGTLRFELDTDLNHGGQVEIHIPKLVENGVPLTTVLTLDENAPTPQTATVSIDISGYSFRFTQGASQNEVHKQIEITAYLSSNPLTPPYYFNLSAHFENMEFHSIFGYFSQRQFSISDDTMAIDLFNNDYIRGITLEDPKIHLQFTNSMGMPIESSISSLKAIRDNQEVRLTTPAGNPLDPILLNYPMPGNLWGIVTTDLTYDKTNSNLDEVLNINPEWIVYDFKGEVNPAGLTYNFVTHLSTLGIITEVEFPFYGAISGITFRDTIRDFDVSLDDLPGNGRLEYLELQILMSNSMPLEASVQVYFADDFMTVTDSLFDGNGTILPAGTPGPAPDYRVVAPSSKRTYVKIQNDQIDKILDAQNVIVRVLVATTNQGATTMKLYSDYEVHVKASMRARYKTSL